MAARPLVAALLVVLAGCSAAPSPPAPATADPTDTPSANHWGEPTLTVAVEAGPSDDRDYAALVGRAGDYWAANAETYAGFPIDFEVRPDADDPDLVVRFVPEVTGCEAVEHVAGCAPYLTRPGQVDRPETVAVLTGLSANSTAHVVKHELGHVLGLGHGDEPADVMAPRQRLTTLPSTNATDRTLPWRDPELRVYVDLAAVDAADRAAVDEQVGHALDYYDRGADGTVPDNVTFVRTENRSAADVVVTFPAESPCGADGGSCGSRWGVDPDDDGAPEWFTSLNVTVTDVPPDAVGWHVAYWLGYGLGFTERGDWPAVLRDADAETRRSDWWNDGGRVVGPRPATAA